MTLFCFLRGQSIPQTESGGLPRVFIIGAGFGGLETARKLALAPVEVTVTDRHNLPPF
jgi:cation diffusion facilitator CzcD-associated flavoprotein CzcO